MTSAEPDIEVRVQAIRFEAEGVHSFDLRPCAAEVLPSFEAGAHVTVQMTGQLSRSYSLVNSQEERDRYVIAVGRSGDSRGGSTFMHDILRVGSRLKISPPRNNFRLAEDARRTFLLAGGIGITPLWAMVQRLEKLGATWEMHYAARSRASAAFLKPLTALDGTGGRLRCHFDDECGGRPMDLRAVVDRAPIDAHLYCCGPAPMLEAFELATKSRPPATVHLEYFSANEQPAEGGFAVELARSGFVLRVPRGSSILDALLARGVDVPYSCREGTCGTCETKVLAGLPDHRDVVLSEAERNANGSMMICCSGCLGERLVLDL